MGDKVVDYKTEWSTIFEEIQSLNMQLLEKQLVNPFVEFEGRSIKIMVCGGYKTGKSSFLNSVISTIVKKKRPKLYCPSDTTSCTACLWVVRYGEKERVLLYTFTKGKSDEMEEVEACEPKKLSRKVLNEIRKELRKKKFLEKNTEEIGYYNGKKIHKVVVEVPSESMKSYEFIDSPGLKERADLNDVVKNLYEECDMVWYVTHTSVAEGFDEDDLTEIRYIANQLTSQKEIDGFSRMRIIANKVDEFLRDGPCSDHYSSEEESEDETCSSEENEEGEEEEEDLDRLENLKMSMATILKKECETPIDIRTIREEHIYPYCSYMNKNLSYRYSDVYSDFRCDLVNLLRGYTSEVLFQKTALENIRKLRVMIGDLQCIKMKTEEIEKLGKELEGWLDRIKCVGEKVEAMLKQEMNDEGIKKLKEEIWKLCKGRKYSKDLKDCKYYEVEMEAYKRIYDDISSSLFQRLRRSRDEMFEKLYSEMKMEMKDFELVAPNGEKAMEEWYEHCDTSADIAGSLVGGGTVLVSTLTLTIFTSGVLPIVLIGTVGGLALDSTFLDKAAENKVVQVCRSVGRNLAVFITSSFKSYDDEAVKKQLFEEAWEVITEEQRTIEKFIESLREEIARIVTVVKSDYEKKKSLHLFFSNKQFTEEFVMEKTATLGELDRKIQKLRDFSVCACRIGRKGRKKLEEDDF